MAAIPIPKEVQPSVAKLLLLTDEENQEIVTALETAPLSFDAQELATSVAERVKSVEPETASEIIQVLLSLYLIQSKAEVPTPQFIEDFIEGIEETDLKETLTKAPVDRFRQRLSRFLQVKALAFTTKARATQNDFENTFCSGQISTDIRPLFESTDGDPTPIAALITHTLKISYHHGNVLKDLFIAVDSDDLDTLEDLVEQARAESEQLVPLLNAAKIPYPRDESE